MKDNEILKIVNEEVDKLCELLGVECTKECKVENGEEGAKYIKIAFNGEDLGYMIGNRGRHLDSLQFMTQIILGRKISEDTPFKVFVDVGGYRLEKDKQLEELALQKADDVRIMGDEVALPPMKPSDRRIVHIALEKFDDITTESRGEGMDRHIVILPAVK